LVLKSTLDAVMHYLRMKQSILSKSSKVYCAFLDAYMAFDKVLLNGLFVKLQLLKKDVSVGFVRILQNW